MWGAIDGSVPPAYLLLCQALAITSALEAAGKSEERTAVLTLLESLRTAKRPELPVLCVKLFRLVSSIARAPGLSSCVCRELEDIADIVGEHLQDIYDGYVAAGLTDSIPLPVLQVNLVGSSTRGLVCTLLCCMMPSGLRGWKARIADSQHITPSILLCICSSFFRTSLVPVQPHHPRNRFRSSRRFLLRRCRSESHHRAPAVPFAPRAARAAAQRIFVDRKAPLPLPRRKRMRKEGSAKAESTRV